MKEVLFFTDKYLNKKAAVRAELVQFVYDEVDEHQNRVARLKLTNGGEVFCTESFDEFMQVNGFQKKGVKNAGGK